MQRVLDIGPTLGRAMAEEEYPNPLLMFEGYLTAVLRSIEGKLDTLFQRAVEGSWIEMWAYQSIEEAVDAMAELLSKIKNLPAFINWAMEFQADASGGWF